MEFACHDCCLPHKLKPPNSSHDLQCLWAPGWCTAAFSSVNILTMEEHGFSKLLGWAPIRGYSLSMVFHNHNQVEASTNMYQVQQPKSCNLFSDPINSMLAKSFRMCLARSTTSCSRPWLSTRNRWHSFQQIIALSTTFPLLNRFSNLVTPWKTWRRLMQTYLTLYVYIHFNIFI